MNSTGVYKGCFLYQMDYVERVGKFDVECGVNRSDPRKYVVSLTTDGGFVNASSDYAFHFFTLFVKISNVLSIVKHGVYYVTPTTLAPLSVRSPTTPSDLSIFIIGFHSCDLPSPDIFSFGLDGTNTKITDRTTGFNQLRFGYFYLPAF